MASLQTLHLAHLPPDLAVHIALYIDLQNASFLREQLLQGNPDFEYALIDASAIAQSLRTFGITATTTNLLAIKLSTDPSITASTVSEHLGVSIKGTPLPFSDATLAKTADVAKIRKLYKLSGVGEADAKGKRRRKDGSEEGSGGVVGGSKAGSTGSDADGEREELEVAILGLMALRGAV